MRVPRVRKRPSMSGTLTRIWSCRPSAISPAGAAALVGRLETGDRLGQRVKQPLRHPLAHQHVLPFHRLRQHALGGGEEIQVGGVAPEEPAGASANGTGGRLPGKGMAWRGAL